jgi:2-hydroxychromene-2-carboxylate isomerase
MKTVVYYMMPISPWTYLGHQRFAAIARRHGATIDLRPMDLTQVFPVSGGLPLGQRPIQRRSYRMFELKRWAEHLGLPLTPEPKHFPVAPHDASKLIIVANRRAGIDAAMAVAGGILAACWAEERDVSDPATLAAVADACALDGAALLAALPEAEDDYARFTRQAIDEQVFGAPWYVYRDEPFWGQDRLDFVDRALAR